MQNVGDARRAGYSQLAIHHEGKGGTQEITRFPLEKFDDSTTLEEASETTRGFTGGYVLGVALTSPPSEGSSERFYLLAGTMER